MWCKHKNAPFTPGRFESWSASYTGPDSPLEVAGSCGDNSAELVSFTAMRHPSCHSQQSQQLTLKVRIIIYIPDIAQTYSLPPLLLLSDKAWCLNKYLILSNQTARHVVLLSLLSSSSLCFLQVDFHLCRLAMMHTGSFPSQPVYQNRGASISRYTWGLQSLLCFSVLIWNCKWILEKVCGAMLE